MVVRLENRIDLDAEVLPVCTFVAVIPVEMYPARFVFGIVDLRHFDPASVSPLEEEDHRERFDGVEARVGTDTDPIRAATIFANVVYVRELDHVLAYPSLGYLANYIFISNKNYAFQAAFIVRAGPVRPLQGEEEGFYRCGYYATVYEVKEMADSTWRPPESGVDEDDETRVERRKEMARALARGGMTGVQVLSHESAERVLTEKRRELVTLLANEDVESVRALARRVDRDKGHVSRDLKLLAEHGVVDFDDEGRTRRPYLQHEHVVVEPIV